MNVKSEKRMLSYLIKRIKAQENLLAVYRIGGRPSNITLDNLAATRDWEEVLEKYKKFSEGQHG